MTHPHKVKGDTFERSVTARLVELGVDAYRTKSAGIPHDAGDVHAGRTWVLSCKAVKAWRMAEWVDAVAGMMVASRRLYGALVVKRWRRPIGEAFVVLELDDLAELIRRTEEA